MNNSISLTMIVKNEAQHLTDCLQSVKNVVDEMIIVDTGSTDSTLKIAESFNAKIFHFDWINDFAAARNFALSKSNCDWILYLDADERLDKSSAAKLKYYASISDNAGYYCTIKSYNSQAKRNDTIRYIRFFKNHPKAHFTGKVHEQITPSLEKLNYKFIHSDILIHHIGYDISKEGRKQKALRNLKLLEEEYAAAKNEYVLFQIAQSNFILENYETAKENFLQLIKSKSLNNQFKAESFSYLSQIFFNDYQNKQAEQYINEAIRLNNTQTFYHLLCSKILLRTGNFSEAKKELLKALELSKNSEKLQYNNLQQVNVSAEEIIYYGLQLSYQIKDSALTNQMKAELGKVSGKIISELIDSLEKQKLINESETDALISEVNNLNLSLVVNLLSRYENKNFALTFLQKLYNIFNDNSELIKNISLILHSKDRTKEAITMLEEKYEIIKSDPSALLYLSMLYLKIGKEENALQIFNLLENNFSSFNEMITKVKAIKEKLVKSLEV
ncbi:MAG: glycosyltransferase [Ignavibacterium sp.]|nr:glycosyltransferase [Ignavibacterium sp.]